jgi:hypothetical protein
LENAADDPVSSSNAKVAILPSVKLFSTIPWFIPLESAIGLIILPLTSKH